MAVQTEIQLTEEAMELRPAGRRNEKLSEMLSVMLTGEAKYDYHWCLATRFVSVTMYLAGAFCAVISCLIWPSRALYSGFSIFLLVTIVTLSIGLCSSEASKTKKRRLSRLVNKLQHHSVSLAPALQLMHAKQDREVFEEASTVLKSHLASLQDDDYMSVSDSQRASLCYVLSANIGRKDTVLALAALKALAAVGDDSVVEPINRIMLSNKCSQETRLECEACLQAIASKSHARLQAKTLLRAGESDSKAEITRSLLRSSYSSDETPEQELLRSV